MGRRATQPPARLSFRQRLGALVPPSDFVQQTPEGRDVSRYIDSPNFVMPSRDMDPPSLTAEQEREIAEQHATETDDLRAAIADTLDDYGGELLDMDDRRRIVTEVFDAWAAKRIGR
jgi:hypothetical protein